MLAEYDEKKESPQEDVNLEIDYKAVGERIRAIKIAKKNYVKLPEDMNQITKLIHIHNDIYS